MSLPDITVNISADIVAWYGAIIATIAALISAYNAILDRPKVRLDFGKNFRRIEEWDAPLFYVSVVNQGRRPVRIDKAWVRVYGYEGEVLLTDSIKTLQERTLDEKNPKISFWTKESTMNVDRIYCVYASTDAGKIYKKYFKKFPTFGKWWWAIRHKKSDDILSA